MLFYLQKIPFTKKRRGEGDVVMAKNVNLADVKETTQFVDYKNSTYA